MLCSCTRQSNTCFDSAATWPRRRHKTSPATKVSHRSHRTCENSTDLDRGSSTSSQRDTKRHSGHKVVRSSYQQSTHISSRLRVRVPSSPRNATTTKEEPADSWRRHPSRKRYVPRRGVRVRPSSLPRGLPGASETSCRLDGRAPRGSTPKPSSS